MVQHDLPWFTGVLVQGAFMSLEEIKLYARQLGVEQSERMSVTELIQAIQAREGYSTCFNSSWCRGEWRQDCAWRNICDSADYF